MDSRGNKVSQSFRVHRLADELMGKAAEIDGVDKAEVYRLAVAQYIGTRATTDEAFGAEWRAANRREWDAGLDQTDAELRKALGDSVSIPEHNEYPEWMREPETDPPSPEA